MTAPMPPLTRRPLRAVFFDLDGTLVDSAPDITAAVNELMAAYGMEPHSLAAVRAMIGNGMETLVERAFAAHGVALSMRDFRERRETMVDIYARNLTRLTTLRPGAASSIAAARAAGLNTGVVTNKPEGFSRIILSHFDLSRALDLVIGGDSGHGRKPSPDILHAACEALRYSVDEAMLVGDSAADADAARAAGMACVILRGGYTDRPAESLGADRIVERLDDLLPIFAVAGMAV